MIGKLRAFLLGLVLAASAVYPQMTGGGPEGEGVEGVGEGIAPVDPDLTLLYQFDLTASLQSVGGLGPTLDFTRATLATFRDNEGIIRTAAAGEARFTGARRVENFLNQSDDMTDSAWTKQTDVTAVAEGTVADPDGGLTAFKIDISAATNGIGIFNANAPFGANVDFVTTQSVYLRTDAAGSGRHVELTNPTLSTDTQECILTIEWQRCSLTEQMIGSDGGMWVRKDTSGGGSPDIFYMWHPQLENVSGQSDTSPSEYLGTDATSTVRLFLTDKVGHPIVATGLLIEETRENLALQSEDLSTGWTITADTLAIVGNEAVAPDGASTADMIIDDSGSGTGAVFVLTPAIVNATSTSYTASAFFKADQLDWAELLVAGVAAQTILVYCDLTNGVLGATTGSDNTSEFIVDYGNGWFRCGVGFTSDGSDTSLNIRLVVSDGDGNFTVAVDGTSSIFAWGADLEEGAFPTSYIATLASSVTRNKDDVVTTDLSWFADGGTFYIETHLPFDHSRDIWGFALSDNSGSDYIAHFANLAGNAQTRVVDTSSTQAATIITDVYATTPVSVRAAHRAVTDDFHFYADGVAAGTPDTDGSIPTNLTHLYIGSNHSGDQQINGEVLGVRYYNVGKPNLFLLPLSQGNVSP